MEINEMAAGECTAVLEHASLGRLGCSYENQPYVVPIRLPTIADTCTFSRPLGRR